MQQAPYTADLQWNRVSNSGFATRPPRPSCFGRIKQKTIPAEDESDALYLDGEVTEYSDQETDSETDVEDNPAREEYSYSNWNANVCIIHPFNL
ncbi:hypothetical protein AVEN_164186-1 [Araneus ventricosus]|uniref:Uncharacterized protein n=1 Tax=Araneus ventricosus TaxID=182803 RepID=A0A4Y2KEC5_ARAVE|nr:hypothetical protein AVEN_164186-1 [Araneus ventricosus]